MGCQNCSQSYPVTTGYIPSNCQSLPTCSSCNSDASGVVYNGPKLTCSNISPGTTLDVILQTIDPLLCAAYGNYSSYNTYCLAPITTQQQFVESISSYVCNTQSQLTTFTTNTFPNYQSVVSSQLLTITNPGIGCSATSASSSISLNGLLANYCTAFSNIDAALSLSGVNWSSCYTVSPAPTTIAQGFSTVLAQICLLKAAGSSTSLPVFNNTGACFSGGTTSDSLVTTINLMKAQICATGTLNTTAISWGCVTTPIGAQNLQDSIQNIVTQLSNITKTTPLAWSSDFTITNVDNTNPCLGKHVALAVPSTQDRYVAATSTDTSPGTLQQKLTAGTNVTLDFTTIPGQAIINSSGGVGTGDHKVATDSADSTPDYLYNKVEAGATLNGITITPSLDVGSSDHRVNFQANLDPVALFTALLNTAQTNPALLTLLCQTIQGCPSPCAAPTNISVSYSGGGSTTTTTTTTGGTSSTTTSTTSSSSTTSTSSSSTSSTSSTSTSSTSSTSTSSTSSTSSSSTSSTTSTSTTAAPSVNIYVGAQSGSTPPTSGVVTGGTITSQSPSGNVNANFVPFNATPQYCWCAIPAAYPKTKWYDTAINNGNIGGVSDLFTIVNTVTISAVSYSVYMTQYATQFVESTQFQP